MQERKKEHLHIRVGKRWKRNLADASRLFTMSQTEIVENAVTTYIDEHWDELRGAQANAGDI